MFTNALPSELVSVAAAVDPDAYGTGAVSSGYVDMSDYESIMAVALAGTLGSSATLDLKLQSAVAASSGTDISGKAITTLTQAGTDSDKQAIVNFRRSEINIDSAHRYVKAVQTVGTATSDAATIILGAKPGLFTNADMSELVGVVATVDPDVYSPGDQSSDWVDISDWSVGLLGVLMVGDLGTAGTVVAKFEQATNTSAGGLKDVTGKVTATLDQTDSPDPSNQQLTIDCRPEDVDIEGGFRYVRLTITVADATSPEDATSDIAGVVFGVVPRTGVATEFDLASVDEVVG